MGYCGEREQDWGTFCRLWRHLTRSPTAGLDSVSPIIVAAAVVSPEAETLSWRVEICGVWSVTMVIRSDSDVREETVTAANRGVMSEGRVPFHQHLQAVDVKVIELFALVAEDLAVATGAVLNGDASALKVISERAAVIDGLSRDLEHTVDIDLALQAPVAIDLRLLLSVLRVVPELERSHGLVVHIAERATPILRDDLSPRPRTGAANGRDRGRYVESSRRGLV